MLRTVYISLQLVGSFNAARAAQGEAKPLTPEDFSILLDEEAAQLIGKPSPAALRSIIERAEAETEDEGATIRFLRSIPKRQGDFVRLPTGSPLTAFFSSMKPKKPIREEMNGANKYLRISGTEKDLLQLIDFQGEINKLLFRSVAVQRVYLLALSKRQPKTAEVLIDFAEYMRTCGLSYRAAAEKELLDAVNAIGFCHFAITQTDPKTGRLRSYHVRHLADADFVRTGNRGKNYIRITFSPFAVEALDENPGLYGMVPIELFRLSQRENKAFSLGVQLLMQSFRNTKRPGRLSIERLAQGLYTAPEERRQKQLFKDPFLEDLALLVKEGIFTRITLYRKGKKITVKEAAALALADFLAVTVEAIPAKPAAALEDQTAKRLSEPGEDQENRPAN